METMGLFPGTFSWMPLPPILHTLPGVHGLGSPASSEMRVPLPDGAYACLRIGTPLQSPIHMLPRSNQRLYQNKVILKNFQDEKAI